MRSRNESWFSGAPDKKGEVEEKSGARLCPGCGGYWTEQATTERGELETRRLVVVFVVSRSSVVF